MNFLASRIVYIFVGDARTCWQQYTYSSLEKILLYNHYLPFHCFQQYLLVYGSFLLSNASFRSLYLLSGQVPYSASIRCLFLFLLLFLYGFFKDLYSPIPFLWILRGPSSNDRTKPLHYIAYIAELHPSCHSYKHLVSQSII